MPRLFGHARFWDAYKPPPLWSALEDTGFPVFYATDGFVARGSFVAGERANLVYQGISGVGVYLSDPTNGRVLLSTNPSESPDAIGWYGASGATKRVMYWQCDAVDPMGENTNFDTTGITFLTSGYWRKLYEAGNPYFQGRGVEGITSIYNDVGGINQPNPNNPGNPYLSGAMGVSAPNLFTIAIRARLPSEPWLFRGSNNGDATALDIYNAAKGTAWSFPLLPEVEFPFAMFIVRSPGTGLTVGTQYAFALIDGILYQSSATFNFLQGGGTIPTMTNGKLCVGLTDTLGSYFGMAPSSRIGVTACLQGALTQAQAEDIATRIFAGQRIY